MLVKIHYFSKLIEFNESTNVAQSKEAKLANGKDSSDPISSPKETEKVIISDARSCIDVL
jgi:hypothetical protein